MDVDLDLDVNHPVSARPLTTTQSYPDLALRPAPPPLDPDDPSTIPDEDLVLDQIPIAEVNRIINSFLPPRSFRDDSDSGSSDEDDQHTTPTQPQPQPQPAVEEEEEDDDRTETDTETDSETSTEYEDNDDEEEEEDTASVHQLPPIPIYNVDPTLVLHTPATALSENTDDMLLAQADAEYSDVGDGGEGEVDGWGVRMGAGKGSKGSQRRSRQEDGDTVMMLMGGDVGDGEVGAQEGQGDEEEGENDLDWDEFLRNPDAFVMEAGLVVAREEEDGDETEEDVEDDDREMADEHDDGGQDGDGDDEEDDINFLMGGLHVGQSPEGYQQVAQQMAEAQDTNGLDLTEYMVDEDVGEDERTKKLRDWFRPW